MRKRKNKERIDEISQRLLIKQKKKKEKEKKSIVCNGLILLPLYK